MSPLAAAGRSGLASLARGEGQSWPYAPHPLVLFALVAVGYGLGSQLAYSWFGADGYGASFFPAAGVTLTALTLTAHRRWPVVLLAAGSAELTLNLLHGLTLGESLGYVAANLSEALVGASLLRAAVGDVDLARTRHLAWFLVCAILAGPAVGGMVGATNFVVVQDGEGWLGFVADWLVGDGLGVLVVGGALLSVRATTVRTYSRTRIAEACLLTLVCVLSTAALFRLEWFPLVYVPIAMLVALAFRVGTRGVAPAGAAVAFVAAEATAEGHRFWDELDISPETGLFYLQLAIGITLTSVLALAAEINQRERTALWGALAEAGRMEASERAEREREISHALQHGLLGQDPQAAAGTELAVAYRPGTATLEVGGDWYDAFPLPDGSVGLVVGDVVGHGLDAAVAMAQLRGAVRALASVGSPAQVLENLDSFARSLPAAGMATVAFVELDPLTGAARYACAGHPPPLVIAADGSTRFLWEGRSAPLGSQLGSGRVDATDQLRPGDTVLLYTDGLVERRTESFEAGLQRLDAVARAAHELSASELVEHLLDTLVGRGPQDDDSCVLAVTLVSPGASFVRSLPAAPTELAPLRHALGAWLDGAGVQGAARHGALLAVSEAAANAVEHAYGHGYRGDVVVEAQLGDEGRLLVAVRDRGGWREPENNGADRGRGMEIMRALSHSLSIERTPRGTVVRMELPARAGVPA